MLPAALRDSPAESRVFLWALVDFALFFALEQLLRWHHCHRASASCKQTLTALILLGGGLHKFIGGLGITAFFLIDVRLGGDDMGNDMIVFGPVPSRRLGQSLGINNIPPKSCSYSCVYCQVGRTIEPSIERQEFHPPEVLVAEVSGRVHEIRECGEAVDFLTFVPDGEPTMDIHLGEAIEGLRGLGIPSDASVSTVREPAPTGGAAHGL